jgi:hypothetical protein
MSSHQLLRTVTARGVRYFIDGKRCTREDHQRLKFRNRQDCFVTRSTKDAVRDWSTVTVTPST